MKKIQIFLILLLLFSSIFLITSCEKKKKGSDDNTSKDVEPIDEEPVTPTYVVGINFDVRGGEKIEPMTNLEIGQTIKLPTPTKEGCEFIGWFLSLESYSSKLPSSYTYNGGTVILYADWMPNRYEITLESKEVNLPTKTLYEFYGEALNIYTPSGDGYEFIGWLLDGKLIDESTLMPNHDITLTAVWNASDIVITLDLNGGTLNDASTIYNIKAGESIELLNPTKSKSIFSGWYDSQGMVYTSHSKFYKSITLTARYKSLSEFEDTYHITYVTEGTVPEGFDEYTVGVEFTLPIPERSGFTFMGWYTSPIYYGEALDKLSNITVYDQTLYAKWIQIKDQYDVTFIYPNSEKTVKVNKNTKVAKETLDEKYLWYNETIPFDFDTLINEDLVLYANFKDLKDELKKIVKPVLTENQTFNSKLTVNSNVYTLTYSSSDIYTLSNKGFLNPDHFDKIIELSITFKLDQEKITQVFKVTVPKINFSNLKEFKPVFAYVYAGSHRGFSDTFINTVDVINLAFGRVQDDSTVSLVDVQSKLESVLDVRKQGIRVVLSIGGGNASLPQFSNAAFTAENRAIFAESLLELTKQYHFDGIDIDWEYPGFNTGRDTSIDRPNYTLLVGTLNLKLKEYNKDLLVTAALPGGKWVYERYALDKVQKYLDFIHLMTYDFHDSQYAYHHTALYSSSNTSDKSSVKDSVDIYVNNGVPIEKIVIGCAFYGRVYILTGPATTPNGIGSSNVAKSGDYMPYTAIYEYLKNNKGSYKSGYDTKACAPYIYIESERKVITYDSANSISAKCNYVNSTNVGGIMYWENGEDQTDMLLQALYKGMKLN